ncbi:type 12 methyltransferase [Mycobacteroides abscessus subsp. bolletii]|uniref:methyltransferase domain-containing protein n=1 Tax=Mycobacteroides abscessus TaxID=36809 RepID=UPI00092700ED|nr:type 12 methyltransferase [Mycobacteroides abscessus subsp. bolletii]
MSLDFYEERTNTHDGASLSLYDIWEQGGAAGDSITPSTYNADYRTHIGLKLSVLLRHQGSLISIGCGNAAVEGDLVAKGFSVSGLDYNAEAIEYAKAKGVQVEQADYNLLSPGYLKHHTVVYADGLFGHLWQDDEGLNGPLRHLRNLVKPGCAVLISNDAPRGTLEWDQTGLPAGSPHEPHPGVSGFQFLSREYVADTLCNHGFRVLESYYFPYLRPISGIRNRTIVIACAV